MLATEYNMCSGSSQLAHNVFVYLNDSFHALQNKCYQQQYNHQPHSHTLSTFITTEI